MRILFVVPYVPSLVRVRPYQFIRELSRQHHVTVLAAHLRRAGEDLAPLESLGAQVEVVQIAISDALISCARGMLRGKPLQASVCQSPAFRNRLRQLLSRGSLRFDVLHLEHLRAADLIDVVPAHVPTLFDAVDSISLLLERTWRASHSTRQRLIAGLELRRTQRFEAAILPRFDRVIATAPEDAEALHRLAPSVPVSVVPNGVDLEYFQRTPTVRDPATLVFSGKMSYHANVTAVLHFVHDIFPLIREKRPDVHLRIVGSNPPATVRTLAADPAITVTGHVTDIRKPLASASVAVCPVTVKVGIQNKILEAMAMGLPVVSSSEGAEGLLAQPERDLLVSQTAAQFAADVLRLLEDEAWRDEMGRAGRRYVETHHRWSAAAARLVELYAEAMAVSGHPAPAGEPR